VTTQTKRVRCGGGRTRKTVAAVVATMAVILTAGCSGSSSTGAAEGSPAAAEGSPAAAELTPVNDQLGWLKITQFGGFFTADANGYYKDEGIAPTFTAGGPNISGWQSVSSGKAQIGDDDNTNVLLAIEKGEPLVVIGAIFQTSPFAIISRADNPIKTIQDVKGKTIALPEAAKQQVEALITAAGISLDDVELVPAGPDPSALASGQVDGYFGYATAQGVALQAQGIDVETLYLEDMGVPSYGNVIITTKDELAKNKDLLVRYMRASIKGYEYLNANPDAGAKVVVDSYGPPDLVLANEQLTAKFQADLIKSDKGVLNVDPTKMQKIIDALVAAGTLSGPLNAADVVDTSVLEEAYAGQTSLLK